MEQKLLLLNHIIPSVISIYYLYIHMKNWESKYKRNKLNFAQVRDNVKNHRRYDWGTGREINWRHTWNNENPSEHKWIEYISIWIKSLMTYILWWIVIALIITFVVLPLLRANMII